MRHSIRNLRLSRRAADQQWPARPRVVLVGPGRRFLGGITYYTYGLANAFAKECELSVLLIRRLVPRRLFPAAPGSVMR